MFFSGRIDYVFYNVLLQGQFRENKYEISSSDMKSIVTYSSMGIVVGCQLTGRIRVHFSISYNYKSKEIMGDERHGWGSISGGFSY